MLLFPLRSVTILLFKLLKLYNTLVLISDIKFWGGVKFELYRATSDTLKSSILPLKYCMLGVVNPLNTAPIFESLFGKDQFGVPCVVIASNTPFL